MKAVIYSRFSSDLQRESSIDDQVWWSGRGSKSSASL